MCRLSGRGLCFGAETIFTGRGFFGAEKRVARNDSEGNFCSRLKPKKPACARLSDE
ncbi:MAG: hypothetical protein V8S82_01810 [Eubacteriales bacterium]